MGTRYTKRAQCQAINSTGERAGKQCSNYVLYQPSAKVVVCGLHKGWMPGNDKSQCSTGAENLLEAVKTDIADPFVAPVQDAPLANEVELSDGELIDVADEMSGVDDEIADLLEHADSDAPEPADSDMPDWFDPALDNMGFYDSYEPAPAFSSRLYVASDTTHQPDPEPEKIDATEPPKDVSEESTAGVAFREKMAEQLLKMKPGRAVGGTQVRAGKAIAATVMASAAIAVAGTVGLPFFGALAATNIGHIAGVLLIGKVGADKYRRFKFGGRAKARAEKIKKRKDTEEEIAALTKDINKRWVEFIRRIGGLDSQASDHPQYISEEAMELSKMGDMIFGPEPPAARAAA